MLHGFYSRKFYYFIKEEKKIDNKIAIFIEIIFSIR